MAARISLEQGYEERVKPAMRRIVDARLAFVRLNNMDVDTSLQSNTTPKERADILMRYDSRFLQRVGEEPNDKIAQDQAARYRIEYGSLFLSAEETMRKMNHNRPGKR